MTIQWKQNAVPQIFPGLPPYISTPKPDKRSSPGKRRRLVNDLHDQQQAEWLDGDSIKSYNDLNAEIRERVTEFPGIQVQNQESPIVLFKFHNDGGIDCNPVVCFCLRIFQEYAYQLVGERA